jgi:hypothetical protein
VVSDFPILSRAEQKEKADKELKQSDKQSSTTQRKPKKDFPEEVLRQRNILLQDLQEVRK